MLKYQKLTINPYGVNLFLVESDNREEEEAFYKEHFVNYPEAGDMDMMSCVFQAATVEKTDIPLPENVEFAARFCIVARFNRNYWEKLTYGGIAHEAYHMLMRTIDIISGQKDSEDEEPYAYLIEWFVDSIIAFMELPIELPRWELDLPNEAPVITPSKTAPNKKGLKLKE